MDYELTKRLKDAGFPKEGFLVDLHLTPKPMHIVSGAPILSELIDACGNDFEALLYEQSELGDKWVASAYYLFGANPKQGRGESPEEAVARLWLAMYADKRGAA